MSIPNYLKHKPIYIIENYASIDGQYKGEENTDVKGLSIGKAQWDSKEFVPSVKVWRKKKRWSRQSEETTLTRALDMATFTVMVLDKYYNEQDIESIDTIFGSVEIQERNKEFEKELKEYLQKEQNKKDLNSHIDILYQALKRYKEKPDKLLCNK